MEKSTLAPGVIPAGEDRFGEERGLGITTLSFKISSRESRDIFAVEHRFHLPGGPARHLHHSQDEWFYALEGEFVVEIGDQRTKLRVGDSIFAPKGVPHVWACVEPTGGRMLLTFAPAGQMEDFFREVTKANAMPPQDPALWRAHGMEVLGPPLALEAKMG